MQSLAELRKIRAANGRSSDVPDTSLLFDNPFSHARHHCRQPLGALPAALTRLARVNSDYLSPSQEERVAIGEAIERLIDERRGRPVSNKNADLSRLGGNAAATIKSATFRVAFNP
jgi:hypothetical protein